MHAPPYGPSTRQINTQIVLTLTTIAFLLRLFRLSNPSQVVFDEVHFGGFSTKYINGSFFMDVHPPLGKLMFAATGLMSGSYNASFSFAKIGNDYLESHVPYITMRLLPSSMGALLVPISYVTCRNLGLSNVAGVLVAGMLLLENGLLTQSRLILLDSGLLFFTGLTVMFWSRFLAVQDDFFSLDWWGSLFLAGVSLGLTCSVKWVGLFLIANHTKRVPSLQKFWTHFIARALCLIFVHFWALPNKGGGSGFMSPEFQMTLKGNGIKDTYVDVGYGSVITMRHHATSGGYLHSHAFAYPGGSKQQQVTCYPFNDKNSEFLIEKPNSQAHDLKAFEPIKDGDIIRLKHVPTNRRLHSHDVRAPVTDNKYHNEVSAYGTNNTTDVNDHWRVQIVGAKKNAHVRAIQHQIKLIHVNRKCALFSKKVKLPEWGFGQQEVTCATNGNRPESNWRIETNENRFLPANSKKVNYIKPGFWSKFVELHQKMWQINNGLTKSHPYESRPPDWPFLQRGINFWTIKEKSGVGRQVYLLGNPLIWWTASLSVFTCVVVLVVGMLLVKRNILSFDTDPFFARIWNACQLLTSGWFFHYFPFFLMHRQLFLHHYFPALYFSLLSIGVVFELATCRLSRRWKLLVAGGILGVCFLVFLDFSPLSYGFMMHKHHCERLKWRSDWDWTCVNSPEEEHELLPHPAEKLHHEDDHKLENFVTKFDVVKSLAEAVKAVVAQGSVNGSSQAATVSPKQ
ncbi:hypothetical protein BDR26DRAFT_910527 [Obelidium mucronatum]|nr:hypothetical protein BDR26DRAFT_910527 [Obelidium mucronatum]